ncbi:MAG: phosphoserine phosphatase SerB [Pseudomonadales bacterium]
MKEVVLINIAGEDKPGLTAAISAILAAHSVHILDIGQAVIHDNLALGILAEVSSFAADSPLVKALQGKAGELGLSARLTPISAHNYNDWVGQQGKPRHIITLLARKVSAQQIARITSVVAAHDLNIDKISRLSGRLPLGELPQRSMACVEFSVRGTLTDPASVRRQLLELANELDVDIAYQEDTMFRRNRRLVAFDMDSTLIETEVIDELAKAAGVGAEVAAITERAMQGELDFKASFAQRIALLKGLNAGVLEHVAANLPLTEGAERLISTLKRLGYRTAIISGGFEYFGHHLQQQLGIDYVFANQLEVKDDVITGQVQGDIVDGERKAQLLCDLAQQEHISLEQVIAVGDGANDLPMLGIAGLGIAFRAKPIVRQSAKHAISTLGLDGILYLIGYSDSDDAYR